MHIISKWSMDGPGSNFLSLSDMVKRGLQAVGPLDRLGQLCCPSGCILTLIYLIFLFTTDVLDGIEDSVHTLGLTF